MACSALHGTFSITTHLFLPIAKGGVLLAVARAHKLPARFIGVGEKAEDLQPFSAEAFARGLVGA